ncbi:hypothetical protein ACH4YO_01790 [Streptomyces noursei]|uniref:hypothetical protein n=1 Tax=Streptomyces noursei TaxID=1971 RepID=UPI003403E395
MAAETVAGMDPATARNRARPGLATVRGLLLDLLATDDRAGVNAAMEEFLRRYYGTERHGCRWDRSTGPGRQFTAASDRHTVGLDSRPETRRCGARSPARSASLQAGPAGRDRYLYR